MEWIVMGNGNRNSTSPKWFCKTSSGWGSRNVSSLCSMYWYSFLNEVPCSSVLINALQQVHVHLVQCPRLKKYPIVPLCSSINHVTVLHCSSIRVLLKCNASYMLLVSMMNFIPVGMVGGVTIHNQTRYIDRVG